MNIIEVKGITKSFKSGSGKNAKTVEAVAGVDLQVAAGQIFGFLGPNGAGKTTLLRILTTLIPPTSGTAIIAGHDILKEQRQVRRKIGYVSQAGGVDESATARENLDLQARLYRLDKNAIAQRIEEMLTIFELKELAARPAKTYSGGQKRRLNLALGMIHRPVLLFLDEPTAGLDPQNRARLWDEIRRLHTAGTTVFLTTHYLEEADNLCQQLAIIDGGKIVAEGTPLELKRQIAGDVISLGIEGAKAEQAQKELSKLTFVREVQPEADYLRLYVEQGEQALPAILRTLDGVGLTVTGISLARPSLDDVFLRQTGRSLRETANN
jgi:ABC-2 type transport system ATP-binding protein